MLENIEVLYHSSIRINKNKVIYIDPFKIDKNYNDADIIFITHNHYDHYSEEDIEKVINKNTTIVIPEEMLIKLLKKGIDKNSIIAVEPNKEYMVQGIRFETIPAYNKNKPYHPKSKEWVGYIIDIDEHRYYIAGDTDKTKEACAVKCDVAFLPVGGTYTMDYVEAAALASKIEPKYVIPTHYGSIVGEPEDGILFKELIDTSNTKCEIYY